jgi:hypothetical protein
MEENAVGDDRRTTGVYDEPPSGIVFTSRSFSRALRFSVSGESPVARLAGEGFIERVFVEPSAEGFRARLVRDCERVPTIGAALLLEVAVALEGGGAATLHLPVTLRDVHVSGLVVFLDLAADGLVELSDGANASGYERATLG